MIDGRIDIGPYENQTLCQDGALRYIDMDATGAETGASWQDAYNTIYEALAECPDGKNREFWAAEGIYFPTDLLDRTISISLPSYSTLYGGWQGNEYTIKERNYNDNITILSGDIGVQNDETDNSFNVIKQDSDSLIVIDGVTIQDGFGGNQGAGIYIENSYVKLANLIIQNNVAIDSSQLYVLNGELLISNVSILGEGISALNVVFDPLSLVFIVNSLKVLQESGKMVNSRIVLLKN